MSTNYDVIILGSGPAGFACAMQSSKLEKKVLVVEANPNYLGGTWINTGTVPSKALREAARTIHEFQSQFGFQEEKKPYDRFKMKDLLQFKDEIIERENDRIQRYLDKNHVDVVHGFGRLEDSQTVEVTKQNGETESFTGDNILISTGSSPTPPTDFTIDHDKILDNQSLLELTHIPRRLVIAGAGVNAIEYATIFALMGTRVTILNNKSDYLTFLDHEIKEILEETIEENQITVRNNVTLDDVDFNPLRVCTEARYHHIDQPEETRVIEAEHVLYIGHRHPNSEDVGLRNISLPTDKSGFIKVNDHYQSNIENIYAAGDVIGFPSLASASFSQGRRAACHMFGVPTPDEPANFPHGIHSIPEISHIGLTEEEAKEQDIDYTIGRAYFKNTTQADLSIHRKGMLKLVFDTQSLKLLGVHIIGAQACDLIHVGQSVMAYDGDIRYFIRHVLNYPSYSEAFRTAAFNGINRVYKAGVKYKNILNDED